MKTHRYISAVAGIALAFTSCSLIGSLDDLRIDYVYTDETVISDAASAENALAGIYASWKSFGNCAFFTNQALRAGTIRYANIVGYDEFQINQLTDDNTSLEQFYTGQYFIINGANSFIEALGDGRQITGLSDERKEEMLSEAYFLKALSEHYLLCTFGQFYDQTSEYGIVIPDGPVRESITKARSTVADSYDVILSDLGRGFGQQVKKELAGRAVDVELLTLVADEHRQDVKLLGILHLDQNIRILAVVDDVVHADFLKCQRELAQSLGLDEELLSISCELLVHGLDIEIR